MKTQGFGGGNGAAPAVVAAVTAYVNNETLSQCFAMGMVDVMSKPLNAKTLEDYVKRYYKRQ